VTSVSKEFYPFILMRIGTENRTEETLAKMFAELIALNLEAERKGARHLLITTTHGSMSAAERKLIARLSKETLARPHRAMLCTFVVLPDALARGALTALKWLIPELLETVGAATPEKTVELAAALLERNGVPFDPVHPRLIVRRLKLAMAGSDEPGSPPSLRR
jgi:hypothetical protein